MPPWSTGPRRRSGTSSPSRCSRSSRLALRRARTGAAGADTRATATTTWTSTASPETESGLWLGLGAGLEPRVEQRVDLFLLLAVESIQIALDLPVRKGVVGHDDRPSDCPVLPCRCLAGRLQLAHELDLSAAGTRELESF